MGNGTLRNCHLKNLQIYDSSVGIGICPSYTPGSCVNVENILFEDVTFEGEQAFLMLPHWGTVLNADDPEIKPVRNITLRNFKGKCHRSSLIAAPAEKGVFSNFNLENVTLSLTEVTGTISQYRWPFEENGVLNVYRMPELDTTRFYGRSDGGHVAVLHKP